MATETKPTDPLRGTIMLADEVYVTKDNKFVVAGTFSVWRTDEPQLPLPKGLAIYARFQTERTGRHHVEILLFDRERAPNVDPLWRLQADMEVNDILIPVEIAINTPKMTIGRPPQPGPDGFHRKRLTIWLEVDGKSIASSPLLIHFLTTAGNPL